MAELNINIVIKETKVIVVFPSNIFSGHEIMAVKILNQMQINKIVYLNSTLDSTLFVNSEIKYFKSFISLIKNLFFLRFNKCSYKIFLISGSPFAYPIFKIFIRILSFYLIEYVPMPELSIMQDKPHHVLMPYINKFCIDKRVLIDSWQIEYSSVKNVSIIKNIV